MRRRIRTAADARRLFRAGARKIGCRLQVAHLDRDGHVLAVESHALARVGGAMVMPIRAVLERALHLDARAVLIAHDHPASDPEPSHADMIATRALVDAARTLDIEVTDHLVFGGQRCASFRQLGLL